MVLFLVFILVIAGFLSLLIIEKQYCKIFTIIFVISILLVLGIGLNKIVIDKHEAYLNQEQSATMTTTEEIALPEESIQDFEDSLNEHEILDSSTISEETEETEEIQVDYFYTELDVELLARVILGEANGIKSTKLRAAVAWCVLNRVDDGYWGDNIYSVISWPHQFWVAWNVEVPQHHLDLAEDVLQRWCEEKAGIENVGRVLPKEYLYFHGNLEHGFRLKNESKETWDWSLSNPYED